MTRVSRPIAKGISAEMQDSETVKPNFFLIGAGKSATTSLAAQLAQHPEVFVTTPKEPHYFSFNHGRGPAWYYGLFRDAAGCPSRGEASVTYSQRTEWAGVADRIHAEIGPDCRIIYIVRHPVEALASHVFHDKTRGHIAVDADISGLISSDGAYVNARRYAFQISDYIRVFGADRVIVIAYEDYIKAPQGALEEIFKFLGVDPGVAIDDLNPRNVSAGLRRRPNWHRALKSVRRRYNHFKLPSALATFIDALSRRASLNVPAQTLSTETEKKVWSLVLADVEELSKIMGRDMVRFWHHN